MQLELAGAEDDFPGLARALAEDGFSFAEVESGLLKVEIPLEGVWQLRRRQLGRLAEQFGFTSRILQISWHQPPASGPIEVGQRLLIAPEPIESSRLVIVIPPGPAFGTGRHPTTQLCLERLEEMDLGGSLLDFGCGAGILALAAARLGANPVAGYDVNPSAVETARRNFELNGLSATVYDTPPPAAFDTVVANLTVPILQQTHADLTRLARQQLLLCGILRPRLDEALALFPDFRRVFQNQREEWACLELVRSVD
ncbi:MAG: 50S ribosomal protein L11 methyltransferase [Vulcanimicrobiota bacterium]